VRRAPEGATAKAIAPAGPYGNLILNLTGETYTVGEGAAAFIPAKGGT
jgi:hypothetical protein